jgi:hypothetical protein
MKTTIEITFKVVVNHGHEDEVSLDENSIKGMINQTQDQLTEIGSETLIDINDVPPESVSVGLSKVKIGGKNVTLGEFGTPDLPWNKDSALLTFLRMMELKA